ncbi:hypothetical protein AB6A40_009208 [Gnathostoma spinigerum]|uniref:SAM domain-containing protein n=1 Tax=Gnathostoma spinigerum TaxID=75299 RepID=A0ABD6ERA8_9BILA
MKHFTDYGPEPFSWNVYRSKCGLTNGSAPDSYFDTHRRPRRNEKLRNLEILDLRSPEPLMYPAKILRSKGHLIWVHLSHYANATAPIVLSTRSLVMFPCGFAQQNGIQIQEAARLHSLRYLPSNIVSPLIRSNYTSCQTPVFVPREKRFLSNVWLNNNDLWLPCIYVRKSCFQGPFISPEKFARQFPTRFSPGPLPAVIHSVVSGLICSAYRPRELSELLSCSKESPLPQMLIKSRYSAKFKPQKIKTRIECCERAKQFCGWLRSICILLDACPDLFGLVDCRSVCESYCCGLRKIPSMSASKHSWTAHVSHKNGPRRCRKIGLGTHCDVAVKRRRESSKIVFHEPRRPLTRAATHSSNLMKISEKKEITRNDNDPVEIEGGGDGHLHLETSGTESFNEGMPTIGSNPKLWTAVELADWVKQSDVSCVAEVLQKEDIDGEAFMLLSLTDCIDHLGLKLGPALKLCAMIKELISIHDNRYGSESSY